MKSGHVSSNTQKSPGLTDEEFAWISRFLERHTGIQLKDGKQAMVMGRLDKRLRHHGVRNYRQYFSQLGKAGSEQETRLAIDLLTTNETYFFRESKHFDFLRKHVFPSHAPARTMRVWSAASSSGEEAYTLAMLLAEYLPGGKWEIVGSDISTRVLETARQGLYPLAAAEKIPATLLKKYCLKGRDEFEGLLLIDPALRARVSFFRANLIEPPANLEMFDLIFLRNVMIYFDLETKRKVVARLEKMVRPGGYFFISHSESLNGLTTMLKSISPSIYRRPEEAGAI